MSHRLAVIAGAVACLNGQVASAATEKCTVVDKSAQVTANQAITKSEDKNAKSCSFSIGGATSSTADPQAVKHLEGQLMAARDPQELMNMFRSERGQGFVLALLGAASSSGRLPDDAIRRLTGSKSIENALKDCMRAAGTANETTGKSLPQDSFQCSVVRLQAQGLREWPRRLYIQYEQGPVMWSTSIPLP